MSNMVSFTFKGILRWTWYRSREYCGPGVLPCLFKGILRSWHATMQHGIVQHGAVHVQGNTAALGCYHVQHAFTLKGILRSRGATMSNMVPFTFKGILRSRRGAAISNMVPLTCKGILRFRCYHVQHAFTCKGILRSRGATYHVQNAFTFKEILRSRALPCATCGVLPCPTWYRSRSREYCGPGVQHGTVHVQGNTAALGATLSNIIPFTIEGILPSRGTTMSNMVSFTFKGILRWTWYRSREYCGPGVLPCPTWYRSRSREYCVPGVLPCPTWCRSRSREYCVGHGTVPGNTAVQGCYHVCSGNTAVLACYHATWYRPTWCPRSREHCSPRVLPCPTCVHAQRNTAVQGRYHVQHGTVHVQGNTAV